MPEMDGIQATKKLKNNGQQLQVLMLTSFSDKDHVLPAIEAGASGYQLKDIEPDELVESIRAIMRGGTYNSSRSDDTARGRTT